MARTASVLRLLVAVGIVGASSWVASSATAAEVDRAGAEFFEKKIRPVLVEQCFECHSKGAKKVGGGLLLDTKAGLAAAVLH